jgi:hypothetical protein
VLLCASIRQNRVQCFLGCVRCVGGGGGRGGVGREREGGSRGSAKVRRTGAILNSLRPCLACASRLCIAKGVNYY